MKTSWRSIPTYLVLSFLVLPPLLVSVGCQSSSRSQAESSQAETPQKGEALLATSETSAKEPSSETHHADNRESPATSEEAPQQPTGETTPQTHTVAKPIAPAIASGVPPVLLSPEEAQLSQMNVGDAIPDFDLPLASGGNATLASHLGKQATVVLFWSNDRWMARAALSDLSQDVLPKFKGKGVSLVGVAVGQPREEVKTVAHHADAKFSQFLDADASVLEKVSGWALPQIYVLDAEGKIAWFDIEYSEATRRELRQTLEALTKVGSE